MNRFDSSADDTMPANDDLRFDLLVDGELSDIERRQLLAGLDDEPGGWRRCALAFLEDQAWRQSMQDVQRLGVTSGADQHQSAPARQRLESSTQSASLYAAGQQFLGV